MTRDSQKTTANNNPYRKTNSLYNYANVFTVVAGIYIGWFLYCVRNFNLILKAEHDSSSLFYSSRQNATGSAGKRVGTTMEEFIIQKYDQNFVQDSSKIVSMDHSLDNKNMDAKNDSGNLNEKPKNKQHRLALTNFYFNKEQTEKATSAYSQKVLGQHHDYRRSKILTAYLEKPMEDAIPGTGSQTVPTEKRDRGKPPDFKIPLPLRLNTPYDLQKVEYPKLQNCNQMPMNLPIDAGLLLNKDGKRVYKIVDTYPKDYPKPEEYVQYCPVDMDPFLPWIHDSFPSVNGDVIHFLAQNKRRCHTGSYFYDLLVKLQPQVALLQPVSVKRINDDEVKRLAPDLWDITNRTLAQNVHDVIDVVDGLPRYKLTNIGDADDDGQFTRFICRFHTMEYDETTNQSRDVILGETLSTYPFNPEYIAWRKNEDSMLTQRGLDNNQFWLSSLQFDCPVPDNGNLRQSIASGDIILDDGIPSIFVDVVPIRTSPRFGIYGNDGIHIPKEHVKYLDENTLFKADERWGDKHVLPYVEASGRYENIPICNIPKPVTESYLDKIEDSSSNTNKNEESNETTKKPFKLTACVWTSESYETRSGEFSVTDTSKRLQEWIEFHKLVGFDHFYIYDNSRANTKNGSLNETLSIFSPAEVTRIEWPATVCNNNKPGHHNTGERSSQYAAELSCLKRYGQFTEWMASFDPDEYLIPMGKYSNLKDVLDDAFKSDTRVLSFKSTRAYLRHNMTRPYFSSSCDADKMKCMEKIPDFPFLEAYNCDTFNMNGNNKSKPDWSTRARKQIYRTDHVLTHFVHYSTVTKDLADPQTMTNRRHYDRYERNSRESDEAVMLHTKTTTGDFTQRWDEFCKVGFKGRWGENCRLGFPWPNNKEDGKNNSNPDGFEYNCYTNEKLTNYWIPELKKSLKKRSEMLGL